jgi:hypothetical protein
MRTIIRSQNDFFSLFEKFHIYKNNFFKDIPKSWVNKEIVLKRI